MNQLAKKIAAEIARRGPISFARFMELALYCPVYGYYEKEGDNIGRGGDFFTSVSVGKAFGELLARQFARWFEAVAGAPECQLSAPGCHAQGQQQVPPAGSTPGFVLAEAGAHRGQLALDILDWFRQERRPIFERLQYWIIEPSNRQTTRQQHTLAEFLTHVRWANGIDALPAGLQADPQLSSLPIVLFCNELLDAMPVRRLGWDAARRAWFEWGVAFENQQFAWRPLAGDPLELQAAIARSCLPVAGLESVLPDGFVLELCPAAADWWHRAARAIARGKIMAVDYGGTAEELLIPERPGGTLRAYRQHQLSSDPLAGPGEQDLTAHVNFTAIQAAGAQAGWATEVFTTQAQFLTAIFASACTNEPGLGQWTKDHIRQFQTLVHPEHLGRAFRVLVQAR